MDDEVLGCGGTLALHARAGADVTVIFLTDGSAGGRASGPLAGLLRSKRQALAEIRREEARTALALLGVQHAFFLDGKDGRLGADPRVAAKLEHVLHTARPEIVYLPFFLEEHGDHRAASRLLLEAARARDLNFQCMGYEVWTPLFPNCLVRIDETVELKKKALSSYASQLAQADYLHTGLGLSAFRSNALLDGRGGHAEAFCSLSVSRYRHLYGCYCALDR
jgi:LmbE family N-acetylglucosaminyl deacetylase